MIVFNVVKEQFGWAVRMGDRMTTPFRSRELAIREANTLADSIRGHGQSAQVVIEDAESTASNQNGLGSVLAMGLAVVR